MIKITLKDGSVKEIEKAMSIIDFTKELSEGLARVATGAEVDGEVKDLRTILDKDCSLNILTFDSDLNGLNSESSRLDSIDKTYDETQKFFLNSNSNSHNDSFQLEYKKDKNINKNNKLSLFGNNNEIKKNENKGGELKKK